MRSGYWNRGHQRNEYQFKKKERKMATDLPAEGPRVCQKSSHALKPRPQTSGFLSLIWVSLSLIL